MADDNIIYICSPEDVVAVAEKEIGYLEKASGYNLYDKTANAGSGNRDKYAEELTNFYNLPKGGCDVQWCDIFFDWCVYEALRQLNPKYVNTSTIQRHSQLLKNLTNVMLYQINKDTQVYEKLNAGAGCEYSYPCYVNNGVGWRYSSGKLPQPGDQIFFSGLNHTGLVQKVTNNSIITIEGNQDNMVKQMDRSFYSGKIYGYGHPDYELKHFDWSDGNRTFTFNGTTYILKKASEKPVEGDSGEGSSSTFTSVRAYFGNSFDVMNPTAAFRSQHRHIGMDIGDHNGKIDWKKVKDSGTIDFALIMLGDFGGTEHRQAHTLTLDSRIKENIQGCVDNHIPYGLWVYTYIDIDSRSDNQKMESSYSNYKSCCESLKNFLKKMTPEQKQYLALPIFLDLEDNWLVGSDYYGYPCRPYVLAMYMALFAQAVQESNEANEECFRSGIYAQISCFCDSRQFLGMRKRIKELNQINGKSYPTDFVLWPANYGTKQPPQDYGIYQFSNSGIIPGASRRVPGIQSVDQTYYGGECLDLNYGYFELREIKNGTTQSTIQPTDTPAQEKKKENKSKLVQAQKTYDQLLRADMDGNGEVTITDVQKIWKLALGTAQTEEENMFNVYNILMQETIINQQTELNNYRKITNLSHNPSELIRSSHLWPESLLTESDFNELSNDDKISNYNLLEPETPWPKNTDPPTFDDYVQLVGEKQIIELLYKETALESVLEKIIILGDLNHDGKVSIEDCEIAIEMLLGERSFSSEMMILPNASLMLNCFAIYCHSQGKILGTNDEFEQWKFEFLKPRIFDALIKKTLKQVVFNSLANNLEDINYSDIWNNFISTLTSNITSNFPDIVSEISIEPEIIYYFENNKDFYSIENVLRTLNHILNILIMTKDELQTVDLLQDNEITLYDIFVLYVCGIVIQTGIFNYNMAENDGAVAVKLTAEEIAQGEKPDFIIPDREEYWYFPQTENKVDPEKIMSVFKTIVKTCYNFADKNAREEMRDQYRLFFNEEYDEPFDYDYFYLDKDETEQMYFKDNKYIDLIYYYPENWLEEFLKNDSSSSDDDSSKLSVLFNYKSNSFYQLNIIDKINSCKYRENNADNSIEFVCDGEIFSFPKENYDFIQKIIEDSSREQYFVYKKSNDENEKQMLHFGILKTINGIYKIDCRGLFDKNFDPQYYKYPYCENVTNQLKIQSFPKCQFGDSTIINIVEDRELNCIKSVGILELIVALYTTIKEKTSNNDKIKTVTNWFTGENSQQNFDYLTGDENDLISHFYKTEFNKKDASTLFRSVYSDDSSLINHYNFYQNKNNTMKNLGSYYPLDLSIKGEGFYYKDGDTYIDLNDPKKLNPDNDKLEDTEIELSKNIIINKEHTLGKILHENFMIFNKIADWDFWKTPETIENLMNMDIEKQNTEWMPGINRFFKNSSSDDLGYVKETDNNNEIVDYNQALYFLRMLNLMYPGILKYRKDDFNYNTGWVKGLTENPEKLIFWIDFLDDAGEISKYSVKNIGQRQKVITQDNVRAIKYLDTEKTVFIEPGLPTKENTKQAKFAATHQGYSYFQLGRRFMEQLALSGQGIDAYTVIENMLYNYAQCAESVTMSTIPLYFLEPNSRLRIYNPDTDVNSTYVLSKLSIPLGHSGTMSLTMTKALEDNVVRGEITKV